MDKSLEPRDARSHSPETADRFFSQLGPLLILTSIFFLNFISRVTLAPLIPEAVSLTVPLASVIGGGPVPIFIGIIGDIGSFAIAIAICGGMITLGAFFTGILKFHAQEI